MIPKILIVEDDNIIQMFLDHVITDMGFKTVGIVNNAAEAFEILNVESPDFILMDVGLRGKIDGIKAAKIIREKKKIPIVFITGNSDFSTFKRILAVDPTHIIKKPIDDGLLKVELKKICDKLDLQISSK